MNDDQCSISLEELRKVLDALGWTFFDTAQGTHLPLGVVIGLGRVSTLADLNAELCQRGWALWDNHRRSWGSRDDLFTILRDRAREVQPVGDPDTDANQ